MESQGVSGGGAQRGQPVERKLMIEKMSQQSLAPVLAGEGALVSNIGGEEEHFQSGWRMVSHTFTLLDDGSGVLTYVLERID